MNLFKFSFIGFAVSQRMIPVHQRPTDDLGSIINNVGLVYEPLVFPKTPIKPHKAP